MDESRLVTVCRWGRQLQALLLLLLFSIPRDLNTTTVPSLDIVPRSNTGIGLQMKPL